MASTIGREHAQRPVLVRARAGGRRPRRARARRRRRPGCGPARAGTRARSARRCRRRRRGTPRAPPATSASTSGSWSPWAWRVTASSSSSSGRSAVGAPAPTAATPSRCPRAAPTACCGRAPAPPCTRRRCRRGGRPATRPGRTTRRRGGARPRPDPSSARRRRAGSTSACRATGRGPGRARRRCGRPSARRGRSSSTSTGAPHSAARVSASAVPIVASASSARRSSGPSRLTTSSHTNCPQRARSAGGRRRRRPDGQPHERRPAAEPVEAADVAARPGGHARPTSSPVNARDSCGHVDDPLGGAQPGQRQRRHASDRPARGGRGPGASGPRRPAAATGRGARRAARGRRRSRGRPPAATSSAARWSTAPAASEPARGRAERPDDGVGEVVGVLVARLARHPRIDPARVGVVVADRLGQRRRLAQSGSGDDGRHGDVPAPGQHLDEAEAQQLPRHGGRHQRRSGGRSSADRDGAMTWTRRTPRLSDAAAGRSWCGAGPTPGDTPPRCGGGSARSMAGSVGCVSLTPSARPAHTRPMAPAPPAPRPRDGS